MIRLTNFIGGFAVTLAAWMFVTGVIILVLSDGGKITYNLIGRGEIDSLYLFGLINVVGFLHALLLGSFLAGARTDSIIRGALIAALGCFVVIAVFHVISWVRGLSPFIAQGMEGIGGALMILIAGLLGYLFIVGGSSFVLGILGMGIARLLRRIFGVKVSADGLK